MPNKAPSRSSLSTPDTTNYIGRFAPSPSGPLHSGSLIAALASFLDAKANQGLWYVRMEDLDPPRESPEAAKLILQTLEKLHLHWDGSVLYQSQRHKAYAQSLKFLKQNNLCFPCTCSRQLIQSAGGIHRLNAGTNCQPDDTKDFAIRCKASAYIASFNDKLQGPQQQDIEQEVGDFVIRRKDKFYAYQLAVVVDDAYQKITHIIRGIDLLESTGRQIYLQSLLQLPTPHYGHIPVIVNELGQKLSKQHFAKPIDIDNPQQLLISALSYLQQQPDPELKYCTPEEIIAWAIKHWRIDSLNDLQSLPEIAVNFKDSP